MIKAIKKMLAHGTAMVRRILAGAPKGAYEEIIFEAVKLIAIQFGKRGLA